MNLTKHIDVQLVSTQVVGQTDSTFIKSSIVDCQGYEGCLFIGIGSTDFCVGTGSTFKVQGSSANSTSAMITYSGGVAISKTTVYGTTDRICMIDVYKPLRRYNRVKLATDTSGAMTFYALRYGPRKPGSTTLNEAEEHKAFGIVLGTT